MYIDLFVLTKIGSNRQNELLMHLSLQVTLLIFPHLLHCCDLQTK
jgi:hypothetical protein